MPKQTLRRILPSLSVVSIVLSILCHSGPARAQQLLQRPSVVHKVRDNDRLEMTVNTSRRLELDQNITDVQVNNSDVLEPNALAPNVVQISAKSPGVTQVNLFAEDGKIFTVDVIVYGDAQELTLLLRSHFPNAALKIIPVSNSVMISGYVDEIQHVTKIIRIAEEFYPKVINNITVSGVHQVMLHVKVMEVSRTKLRIMGFDWAKVTGPNLFQSGVSGLLDVTGTGAAAITTQMSPDKTINFNIIEPGGAFFGVMEALREDKLAKVLAEPTLVTVSGRPAKFLVGGKIGYVVNGGITGTSTEWLEYGTTLDFVPIVLGNGRVRLEVRPEVSEIDAANSAGGIPAIKTREVETGVELKAGQTLALAGLIQTRVESMNRGLPWISEVPLIGMPFRRVEERNNEVELLITVTPELVDAMDADQVPRCGPGSRTTSPSDWELFVNGYPEVPVCCPNGDAAAQPGPAGSRSMPNGVIIQQPHPTAASHNPYNRPRSRPSQTGAPAGKGSVGPGFIGPVGYDVLR